MVGGWVVVHEEGSREKDWMEEYCRCRSLTPNQL